MEIRGLAGSCRFLAAAALTIGSALLLSAPVVAQDDMEDMEDMTGANYVCDGGKTIDALFFDDSADLLLDDGTNVTLQLVESGSGARYSDGTMVFWIKGAEASITEGGKEKPTYANCVDVTE